MAIILPPPWQPTSTTSFNLNYYKPSLRPTFGIPSGHKVANFSNRRSTIYTVPKQNFKYTDADHSETGNRFNKQIGRPVPEGVDAFLSTLISLANVNVEEEKGVYGVDYDWENGTWSSRIDSQPEHNGTFSIGPQHLILPSLGLQIPNFALFARSCKYEPFLKTHRGNGNLKDIETQGEEKYRHNSKDVVLRTAAFGMKQDGLEICARRRDILDKDGGLVTKGLGPEVHVVAGLIASYRWREWNLGRRKGCRGSMLNE